MQDIVKSTLGPRGMDKLIEEGGDVTITNDGATVRICVYWFDGLGVRFSDY